MRKPRKRLKIESLDRGLEVEIVDGKFSITGSIEREFDRNGVFVGKFDTSKQDLMEGST